MTSPAASPAATIERVQVADMVAPGHRWTPEIGPETADLLEHLGLESDSRNRILQEAWSVIGRCVPPAEDGQGTGLVVGYVQSGKTMSFTTVAALARDNGYAIVVVIAGTTVPLLNQSTQRLHADLRIASRDDRAWLTVSSVDLSKASRRKSLRAIIEEWREPESPESERRTILITAMKHHGHLKNVIRALSELSLDALPTLVIDDEADQASLNTLVTKSDESTTYRQIKALRACLPHHTYLQYTATPQAPLLINIIDTLSPDFAEVLTPGEGYVGGIHFFKERPELVKLIPSPEHQSESDTPSDSLLSAMRFFFLGVAAGLLLHNGRGNRSMMVHPSQRTRGHSEYYAWVQTVLDTWQTLIGRTPGDFDREDLLDEFREEYTELALTVDNLPSFKELVTVLPRAIRKTCVEEINAKRGETPRIEWKSHYSWILVGGQAMDRGFTVEGLTVTYMPRSVGVGNADTIQQRARFFGYKRDYLGYCRIFLAAEARDVFARYVEHEEDVRKRLVEHRDSGESLSTWKRSFFLDVALKPTRRNVLDLDYIRSSAQSEWFYMRAPHESKEAVEINRCVVEEFLNSTTFVDDAGSPDRSEHQIHGVAVNVPLKVLLRDLLTALSFPNAGDFGQFFLLQLVLSEHLEAHPDTTCVVYQISKGRERERTLNARGEIINLFQGAHPSKRTAKHKVGDIYRGDREIASNAEVPVVQIHRLRIIDPSDDTPKANVPAVAIRLPPAFRTSLLVQDQPEQGRGC